MSSTLPTDEQPPVLLPLKFDLAATGRAGCFKCKEKIGEGEPRLGIPNPQHKTSFAWFHPSCAVMELKPPKTKNGLKCKACKENYQTPLLFIGAEGNGKSTQMCHACFARHRREQQPTCEDKFYVDVKAIKGFEELLETPKVQSEYSTSICPADFDEVLTKRKADAALAAEAAENGPPKKKARKKAEPKVVKAQSEDVGGNAEDEEAVPEKKEKKPKAVKAKPKQKTDEDEEDDVGDDAEDEDEIPAKKAKNSKAKPKAKAKAVKAQSDDDDFGGEDDDFGGEDDEDEVIPAKKTRKPRAVKAPVYADAEDMDEGEDESPVKAKKSKLKPKEKEEEDAEVDGDEDDEEDEKPVKVKKVRSPKVEAQSITEKTELSLYQVPITAPEGKAFFKAVTWNVAGLRALIVKDPEILTRLSVETDADMICIQEHKLQDVHIDEFKEILPGFTSHWAVSTAKKGYSGVAVFVRDSSALQPAEVRVGIGNGEGDAEGRSITLDYPNFSISNLYVPNSGASLVRINYRLETWDKSLLSFMNETQASTKNPVVYCGDLNVAHGRFDVWNDGAKHLAAQAGTTPRERASFSAQLEAGYVDAFRHLYPDAEGHYTYWSNRAFARAPNKGLRLDYFVCSKDVIIDRKASADGKSFVLRDSYMIPDFLGSDHSPAVALFECDV